MDDIFRKVHIFTGLSEPGLEWLAGHAERQTLPPAELIVSEGEPGSRFYVVADGAVRVVKHFGQPQEVLLATLKAGDFFGEMCILEAQPRAATVATITEATVYSIGATMIYHFYEQMPAQYGLLLLNIARDLSRRLRRLDDTFAAKH